ncbi:hypothetical protein [Eastern grey kangaroopox virus]|uniref:Uncharacterized protein n=1 Tax=Eastern grey kangaroopox virus TaxID=2042482 RepID=A0A2C9DSZ2_9POXV|nr:hypothetical protein KM541_gp029 [Eastern grey kangaroopox virus]ATI21125.1 hypothetical protein [Eastern grey kangaroopox virus]AXK50169.1 hypothetical protein EKPV-NSW-ORF042 [Eastern grey kangaroopox virus]
MVFMAFGGRTSTTSSVSDEELVSGCAAWIGDAGALGRERTDATAPVLPRADTTGPATEGTGVNLSTVTIDAAYLDRLRSRIVRVVTSRGLLCPSASVYFSN